MKADSQYYLKYVDLLQKLGLQQQLEEALQDFNPAFDIVPSYIWYFLLANYY